MAVHYMFLHLAFLKSVHQSLEEVGKIEMDLCQFVLFLESSFQCRQLQNAASSFVKCGVFCSIILALISAP